jgi:hypothetical protein
MDNLNSGDTVYSYIKVYLCKINSLTAIEAMYHFMDGKYKGSMDAYEYIGELSNLTLQKAFYDLNSEELSFNTNHRPFNVGDILETTNEKGITIKFLCKSNGWEELSI